MNPYFPQHQGNPQFPQIAGQATGFQGLQNVGIANPLGTWPTGFGFPPGYQYQMQIPQVRYQMPIQQTQNTVPIQNKDANHQQEKPPLPTSQPPIPEPPKPPPPEDVVKAPAPPPPDDVSVENVKMTTRKMTMHSAIKGRQILQGSKAVQQKPTVGQNLESALQYVGRNANIGNVDEGEDLQTLNNQLHQLEGQMKKYQSEYEQWHKEFTAWQRQHENHPDQKQYIQYQQKYQKMIEQQQQALKQQYIELQTRISRRKNAEKQKPTSVPAFQPVQSKPQSVLSVSNVPLRANVQPSQNIYAKATQAQAFSKESNYSASNQPMSQATKINFVGSRLQQPNSQRQNDPVDANQAGLSQRFSSTSIENNTTTNTIRQAQAINQQNRSGQYMQSDINNQFVHPERIKQHNQNTMYAQSRQSDRINQYGQPTRSSQLHPESNSEYNEPRKMNVVNQQNSLENARQFNQLERKNLLSQQNSTNQFNQSQRGKEFIQKQDANTYSQSEMSNQQSQLDRSGQFNQAEQQNRTQQLAYSERPNQYAESQQNRPMQNTMHTGGRYPSQNLQQRMEGPRTQLPTPRGQIQTPNRLTQPRQGSVPVARGPSPTQNRPNAALYRHPSAASGHISARPHGQTTAPRAPAPNTLAPRGRAPMSQESISKQYNQQASVSRGLSHDKNQKVTKMPDSIPSLMSQLIPNQEKYEKAGINSGESLNNKDASKQNQNNKIDVTNIVTQPEKQIQQEANYGENYWDDGDYENLQGISFTDSRVKFTRNEPSKEGNFMNQHITANTTQAKPVTGKIANQALNPSGQKFHASGGIVATSKAAVLGTQIVTSKHPVAQSGSGNFEQKAAAAALRRPLLRGTMPVPEGSRDSTAIISQSNTSTFGRIINSAPAVEPPSNANVSSVTSVPGRAHLEPVTSKVETTSSQPSATGGPAGQSNFSSVGGSVRPSAPVLSSNQSQPTSSGPSEPTGTEKPVSGDLVQRNDLQGSNVKGDVVTKSQTQSHVDSAFKLDPKHASTTEQSNKFAAMKATKCRYFPNCRYGGNCFYKHPACPKRAFCNNPDCIFEHAMGLDEVNQFDEGGNDALQRTMTRPQTNDNVINRDQPHGDVRTTSVAMKQDHPGNQRDNSEYGSQLDEGPAERYGYQDANERKREYDDYPYAHTQQKFARFEGDNGQQYMTAEQPSLGARPQYPTHRYDDENDYAGRYDMEHHDMDYDRSWKRNYGGEAEGHFDSQEQSVRPSRDLERDRLISRRDLNGPRTSPPRREYFKEKQEFEKRYHDWEKNNFPVEDPTREWEFELRRRQLLGREEAERLRRRDIGYSAGRSVADDSYDYPPRDYFPRDYQPRDYPSRDYPPRDYPRRDLPSRDYPPPHLRHDYDREGYGLPMHDRHPGREDYDGRMRREDPFYGRPTQHLRPTVFDYGHETKLGLYDVDLSKIKDADSEDHPTDAKLVDESSSSTIYKGADHSIKQIQQERPPGRIPSPKRRSKSPHTGSSPRRKSRSPRRSVSGSRRSKSPSRRSRRSASPRRRHSPSKNSRREDRSRDRSRDKDDRSRSRIHSRYNDKASDREYGNVGKDKKLDSGPFVSGYESIKNMEPRLQDPGPEIVPIKDILDTPGRNTRPKNIVIILRGPPGCGKTHIAKIIKDKEVSFGAHAPRILALDDYFIQETDTFKNDESTGRKVKVKKIEYVYEKEMETAYRASLLKSFNKTLDNGYFPMVIIDAVNNKVEHFQKFWSDGKHKGFEVYIAEMHGDASDCAERNIHNWLQKDIQEILDRWEPTPNHFKRLDVRSLVQDAAIEEVEMEEVEQPAAEEKPEQTAKNQDQEDDVDEEDLGTFHVPKKSKWEETKEEQLAKLDGIRPSKEKRKTTASIFDDDYDDDPYDEREEDMRIGKKRVRWADIEERKQLEHRKRIGFCIGTDWSVLTDPNAEVPL